MDLVATEEVEETSAQEQIGDLVSALSALFSEQPHSLVREA